MEAPPLPPELTRALDLPSDTSVIDAVDAIDQARARSPAAPPGGGRQDRRREGLTSPCRNPFSCRAARASASRATTESTVGQEFDDQERAAPPGLDAADAASGPDGGGRRVRQQSISPSRPDLGSRRSPTGPGAPPVAVDEFVRAARAPRSRRRRRRRAGGRGRARRRSSDGGLQTVRNRRGRHRPLRRAGPAARRGARRPPDRGGPARGPDEDVHAGGTGRPEHPQRTRRPKTTKLYDRPADTVTVDEIERIVI